MARSVRFKDMVLQFEKLQKNIAARQFAPIYLLMGNEGYFIDELCNSLANTILNEAERTFNQIIVYGKDTDEGQIINMARQLPMMGNYQVVIVKEATQLSKIDKLSIYTETPSPSTILIICYKGKSVDKRSAFYKHVAAKGVVFETVTPYDNELTDWLAKYISGLGFKIDDKAITMLTDHIGSDITKLTKEIGKLVTSMPDGVSSITAQTIENNIGISKEFNIFELQKAIATKNKTKALIIADYFSRNSKSISVQSTIKGIFDYFQRLFILNYKRWQNKHKGICLPQDKELAELLGINPFFLNEYKRAADLYPNKKIFLIFGILREYDMKSKGFGGETNEDDELLKELLLKIFTV